MGQVLSTAQRAPPSWAICAMAAMSAIFSCGFDGDSIQTSCVSARMAAATLAGSVMSTAVTVSPQRPNTSATSAPVPK